MTQIPLITDHDEAPVIPGLTYLPDFLTSDEHSVMVQEVEQLRFREIRMRGVVARRTAVHFGFDYVYEGRSIEPTEPPPPWLVALRDRAASAAARDPVMFEQFLIARYPPGAPIGWHRDAPMFGSPVLGISLRSPAQMRFRRLGDVNRRETLVQHLAPGSLYIIDGEARSAWQHSVPPVKALRYAITMRTVIKR